MASIVLETEDGHREEVPRALLPHLPVLDRLVAFEGERPTHAVDHYTLDLLRAVGLDYAHAAADGQLDAYALPGDDGDTSRDALRYLGVDTADLLTVRELRAKMHEMLTQNNELRAKLRAINEEHSQNLNYVKALPNGEIYLMAANRDNGFFRWFDQAAPMATFEDFWAVRDEWLPPNWRYDKARTRRFWDIHRDIHV